MKVIYTTDYENILQKMDQVDPVKHGEKQKPNTNRKN